jgi:hypothetical protein
LRETSKQTVARAYIKPVIQFAVGALILSFVAAASESPSEMGLYFGLRLAIGIPVGVLAFFLCCMAWIGFDAPLHLIAIRLAGVYAVTDAAAAVLGYLPVPMIPFMITMAIYIGLLADSLELDLQDAVLVGVVTWFIKVMAMIFIVAYLVGVL